MAPRVIVGGAIAHHPIGGGGNAWLFLQYVLGFRRLGCDVLYVEHLAEKDCFDRGWRPVAFGDSFNAAFFRREFERVGLGEHAALLQLDGDAHFGRSRSEVREWAGAADLFVNLSGRFRLAEILRAPRRRLYVDLDPGFTQVWQHVYGVDMNLGGHDSYATVGLNLGRKGCPFPSLGLRWHATVPPVVLSEWEPDGSVGGAYTTIADWRGYEPVEWCGVRYGQKSEEFLRVLDLPSVVGLPLAICLAIHPSEPDLPRLLKSGWRLENPRRRVADLDSYRRFIRASRGEFSVAKNGYVKGRAGWVSDRTVCYLAAGRPAIVQDTGLRDHLEVGSGLLVFDDIESAAEALRRVERQPVEHAQAARALARLHFDSDRVLARLLDIAGV